MSIIQHLVLDERGLFLGKHSERLVVSREGKAVQQAPLLYLETVTIASSGISLSADAVAECSERGIPIFFLDNLGRPYASLYSAGLTGTALTRRAQIEALHTARGLHFALQSTSGKLQNQINLLRYIGKYRKETHPALYQEIHLLEKDILDGLLHLQTIPRYPEVQEGSVTVEDLRNEIMGIEGTAARCYWEAVGKVLPEALSFPGRRHQGATDPVNACLNYGYGILYGQCEKSLVLAGLDPYAGFLHADRPGKPSLTLDFIEEFRQAAVDRVVIGMLNKGTHIEQDERGLLTRETRGLLADKVRERLEAPVQFADKRYPLRIVLQMQARFLATYLRGERDEYVPYLLAW